MSGRLVCVWCPVPHDMGPAESEKDSHGLCAIAAAKFEASFEGEVTDTMGESIP